MSRVSDLSRLVATSVSGARLPWTHPSIVCASGSMSAPGPPPQWPTPGFIVRASGSPAELLPTVRKAIAEAEPQVSFITLETMAAMQGRSVAEERYRAQLAVGFAGSALLLAGIGLYGLLARSIRDQRREMGVRLALGAAPREVRRLVMSKALGLVALGLIPGIPAALAAGRAIGSSG